MENKTLRVSFAKQTEKIVNTNLYIAYLTPNVTDKIQLKNLFETFGKVQETKLLTNENGTSKGVGFVRFETRKDAEQAIQSMNGSVDVNICNGQHPLVVKFSDTDKKKTKKFWNKLGYRNQMMGSYRYNPLGVGNAYTRAPNPYSNYPNYVAPETASQFSSLPYPNSSYPNSTTTTGYPSSTYSNTTVPSTTTGYPATTFPTYPLPSLGVFPTDHHQTYCLYVCNLPPETDDNLLYRIFGPFGAIASVKVIKEAQSTFCKGYAFVNFNKYEEAYSAVASLNGTKLKNKILQVRFKKQK